FGGTPFAISPITPTVLQAENFDLGGEGVAYHDTDAANLGGAYRPTEAVDLEPTTNPGGGYDVGWMHAGEYLQYTVNVAADADYHDTAPATHGGAYRPTEAVDIEPTTDTGGGFDVGWTHAGEWLAYTVDVLAAGNYTFGARVASAASGGSFRLASNAND